VTLEVIRTDKAVTKVELYLGEYCDDCPGVMAPPGMTPRRSRVWVVNDPAIFSASETDSDSWHGDRAGFRLTSSTGMAQRIPAIIAVGYDANNTPIATSTFFDGEIPVNRAERWQTTLVPSKPIVDPRPDVDDERVAVWGQQRTGPRCVMIEHGTGSSDAIVPVDDTDCDGVSATAECNPYVANAVNGVPTLETANCVTTVAANNLTGICMLGGPVCNEAGPTSADGCESLDVDYCVPKKLCAACPNGDFDCIKTVFGDAAASGTPVMNGLDCTIPLNPDGSECDGDDRRFADLDISALVANSETKCRDVEIGEGTLPLTLHHSLPITDATINVRDFNEPCNVRIEWGGHYMRTAGDVRTIVAEVELDNGKHILAPFILRFGESCLRPMTCTTVVPDPFDPMFDCVKPTEDSMTCSPPDPLATCGGGELCGARCCNVGEACVDGACRCGAGPHCLSAQDCIDAPSAGCGTRCATN
jgi:hypothetical protein